MYRASKGCKSALLMLSTDIIFSHFIHTFVLLSGSTSFYVQEFITCHEMQQCLGAYLCEKQLLRLNSDVIMMSQ